MKKTRKIYKKTYLGPKQRDQSRRLGPFCSFLPIPDPPQWWCRRCHRGHHGWSCQWSSWSSGGVVVVVMVGAVVMVVVVVCC
jgi:hypothetical protein